MNGPTQDEAQTEIEYRRKRMRRDFMAGRIGRGGKRRAVAVKCSWCGNWFSDEDERRFERGAEVSHGMCKPCQAHVEGRDLEPPR